MKTKVYIILDLPRSVEWMIRGPYTPSLRVFKQHPLQDAGIIIRKLPILTVAPSISQSSALTASAWNELLLLQCAYSQ